MTSTCGGSINAMTFISPPHSGQANGSISYTRLMSMAQIWVQRRDAEGSRTLPRDGRGPQGIKPTPRRGSQAPARSGLTDLSWLRRVAILIPEIRGDLVGRIRIEYSGGLPHRCWTSMVAFSFAAPVAPTGASKRIRRARVGASDVGRPTRARSSEEITSVCATGARSEPARNAFGESVRRTLEHQTTTGGTWQFVVKTTFRRVSCW